VPDPETTMPLPVAGERLLEREGDLSVLDAALDRAEAGALSNSETINM
jgi:hypothetical protein